MKKKHKYIFFSLGILSLPLTVIIIAASSQSSSFIAKNEFENNQKVLLNSNFQQIILLSQGLDKKIQSLNKTISNSNYISDLIKFDLLTENNKISSDFEFERKKVEIEALFQKAKSALEQISKIKAEILQNQYGGDKAFRFYNLLAKNKDIITDKVFDFATLDTFFDEINIWQKSKNDTKTVNQAFKELVDASFDSNRIEQENKQKWKKLDLERFMNVASLNYQSAPIMLKNLNTEQLIYEIENIKWDSTKTVSIISYKISHSYNPKLSCIRELKITGLKNNVDDKINQIKKLDSLDSLFDINYYLLSRVSFTEFNKNFDKNKANNVIGLKLYADQNKEIILRKKKYIQDFFEYKISETPKFENNKLVAEVEFLFNKNLIFKKKFASAYPFSFLENEHLENEIDKIDLKEARRVLASYEEILANLFPKKEAKISHQDIYPDEILEKFPKLYDLPTFGKYRLAPKTLIEAKDGGDIKGGVASIKWAIQEFKKATNTWEFLQSEESFLYKMEHFKRYQYYDFIKPKKGDILTQSDFIDFEQIDSNLKTEIDKLNEADIDFRYVLGQVVENKGIDQKGQFIITRDERMYRNLNPKELLAQNAQIKTNYFLKLIKNQDKKTPIEKKIAHYVYPQGYYIPRDKKYLPQNVTSFSSADNDLLIQKTFYYFYDIRQENDTSSISFRLGFVLNNDPKKRYTPLKRFLIHNVVSDYEQNLYPEIMLNNLTSKNIGLDKNLLATKTVAEWKRELENSQRQQNSHDLLKAIYLINTKENLELKIDENFIEYKNFKLVKSYFKIAEIKEYGKDTAFIRFKVQNYDKLWKTGKNWYLIKGFKPTENAKQEKLTWDSNKLATIYYENEIWRSRELEPYIEEAEWNLQNPNLATWHMENKYIKHTFLTKTARARKLDIKMYADILLFGQEKKASEIQKASPNLNFLIDFDKLLSSPFIYRGKFQENVDSKAISIDYVFKAEYNFAKQGIDFSFKSFGPYKIKLGYGFGQYPKNGEKFDLNRAIIIPYAPLKIQMEYKNTIQNEGDFGLGKTNLYDYNKVSTAPSGQVYLLYNDASYYAKKIYNPNQNVYWKHNDGYIPDVQWIRDEWGTTNRDWDLINRARDNSAKYDLWAGIRASAGFLGKINDDPSDLNLYYITNWHNAKEASNIEANENGVYPNQELEPKPIKPRSFSLPLNKYNSGDDNYLFKGYRDNQNTSLAFPGENPKLIYIGNNRKSNLEYNKSTFDFINKKGEKSDGHYDVEFSHINFENTLKKAKISFKEDIINQYQNIINSPKIQLNQSSDKNFQIVPVLNPFAHIGFPGWGFLTGYVNNRRGLQSNHYRSQIYQFPNYSPMLFGPGSSGTSVWSRDGDYIATWTGGVKGLFAWYTYIDNPNNNFWGINWENENPLDNISFKNSIGHMILRQALNHPFKYSVPWFYKKII